MAFPPKANDRFATFLRECRKALVGLAGLSAMANLLALTGSLYMLQVYDRVLPSRSIPTLVGLTLLMVGLYVAFGIVDFLRGRIVQGLGIRFDRRLREPIFAAVLQLPMRVGDRRPALQPIRDLDQIRSFLSSPGPSTLTDLPWLPACSSLLTRPTPC